MKQSNLVLLFPHRRAGDEIEAAAVEPESGNETTSAENTMSAEADLERGLPMEVKRVLESFTGFRSGQSMASDGGRQSPAVARVLERKEFPLLNCRTEQIGEIPSPPPSKKSDPPSDSLHAPRAGGDEQRRPTQRRSLPIGESTLVAEAEARGVGHR
jgi:hypothetical protein